MIHTQHVYSDCETGCTECHETWTGGTSVCSACDERDVVPSGSECIENCKTGQFQEFKACKGQKHFFLFL